VGVRGDDGGMLLIQVVEVSAVLAATRGRRAKIDVLAGCLRAASVGEVPLVVGYLSGRVRQRRTGVGYAALRRVPEPAGVAGLSLSQVDGVFEELAAVAGVGAAARRGELLRGLLGAATAGEQEFLVRLLAGEVRHGALDGVMVEAVAVAAGVEVALVRRAVLLRGELAAVAVAALEGGAAALAGFGLRLGRPLRAMLAASAGDVGDALARTGPAGVEWKLDGVRVQVHRDGRGVRVFSRGLEELTGRMPEVEAVVAGLPVRQVVLDGEVVALRADGRPEPFQVTAARVATRAEAGPRTEPTPASASASGAGVGVGVGVAGLSLFLFDVLHVDGVDVLDEPYARRREALAAFVPAGLLVPRLVTGDAGQAREFLAQALRAGHEGVVVKALDAPYAAGRRGAGWVKVKPRHTLDLVVLGAEWGHGRRQGWLSNLHVGARNPRDGSFVMLGKTFKGLTDAMLAWQTERLLELRVDGEGDPRRRPVVWVRPELVVEVAFDGLQASSRYPGGLALRFARVVRYRPDKGAGQADSIEAVRAIDAAVRGRRTSS
jgi:ATP-dependent DNA ligase I